MQLPSGLCFALHNILERDRLTVTQPSCNLTSIACFPMKQEQRRREAGVGQWPPAPCTGRDPSPGGWGAGVRSRLPQVLHPHRHADGGAASRVYVRKGEEGE